MRALFVAFYFPPAGGGGVQRTLKFCKYLPEFGIEVHVLTPDDPKWFARDERLLAQIPGDTVVHRARFLGPRSSFRADAIAGRRGLSRLAVEARYAYQRALVPDKATPWMATAVPAGIRIARRHGIDVVLSTSPPPSVHLTAEAIAAATRLPWVADFRDSWLANPHRDYEKLGVRAKRVVEERMARSVGRRATRLVAATGAIGEELGRLHPTAPGRVTVIENGADFDDFAGLAPGVDDGRLTIVHAGSFFGKRTPRVFLQAMRDLIDRRPELDGKLLARFVGEMRPEDRALATELRLDGAWEETGFLSYADALAAQRSADALLLLIPDADGRGDTVLSGKVFEYIAAARPILAAVPPGGMAADLVRRSGAGEVADGEDAVAVSAALERLADRWLNGGLPDVALAGPLRDELSRRSRARDLAEVLRSAAA